MTEKLACALPTVIMSHALQQICKLEIDFMNSFIISECTVIVGPYKNDPFVIFGQNGVYLKKKKCVVNINICFSL